MSLTIDEQIDAGLYALNERTKEAKEKYERAIKKIADSMSYPKPDYFPSMAKFIERATVQDECIFYIPYGPLRYGKTAYSVKSLAGIYDTWNPEVLRRFIVFKPQEFIKLKKIIKSGVIYPSLLWEDAGVHLAYMKWQDPLLQSIIEYFNVIGTHFHSVIFTTPLPTYVVSKLRGLPACSNIRIYKINNNPSKPRVARGYYQWLAPDMKKSGVKPFIDDRFSAIMPTKFYEWYKPYRQMYADEGFLAIENKLYSMAKLEYQKNPEPPKLNENSQSLSSSIEGVVGNGKEAIYEEESPSLS